MKRSSLPAVAALVAALALAGCANHSAAPNSQRVAIQVTDKGFEPKVVNVKAGQPVTLVVTRTTDQTCATELVMTDPAIKKALPLNQAVEINFTPSKPGDVVYACGMDMYHGRVHAE